MVWFITGLRHETIRLAKKQERLREHELFILNKRLSGNDEDELTEMLDTIADPSNTIIEVENLIFLQEALSLLTPRQQQIIKAIIMEEQTESVVAIKLGISQSAVHQVKERALNQLKKHFVLDKPTIRSFL